MFSAHTCPCSGSGDIEIEALCRDCLFKHASTYALKKAVRLLTADMLTCSQTHFIKTGRLALEEVVAR